MAHVLIAGTTESGKSSLARELCANYTAGRLVLDPIAHPSWIEDAGADRLVTDSREFLRLARASRGCALFIDEAPHVIGRNDHEAHWLATQARHWGHWSHFIAQHPTALPPVIRGQCPILFLFRVDPDSAELCAREWTQPDVRDWAPTLGQGEFLEVRRFGGITHHRLF